ncbi:uncharacterized protein LOC103489317 isoform X2 [Cucumis melo]|uniref:Uncharacterized protein LOC103489317 isoform X2 n=1 Tax=Cucumis melo TaxID=3656 RepID=A0A1S3BFL1_CUCME|nr:uncharacterized protein LOC103489317 isoform X2 [Cucumis melo]
MADSAEEFEPLFDYSRVQPPSVVCLDDEDSDADKSPAPFTKRAKIANLAATSSVNGNPKEKQVEIEDNEEDWLPPPPKVLVDGNNRRGEDSTLKELRYSNLVLKTCCEKWRNLQKWMLGTRPRTLWNLIWMSKLQLFLKKEQKLSFLYVTVTRKSSNSIACLWMTILSDFSKYTQTNLKSILRVWSSFLTGIKSAQMIPQVALAWKMMI